MRRDLRTTGIEEQEVDSQATRRRINFKSAILLILNCFLIQGKSDSATAYIGPLRNRQALLQGAGGMTDRLVLLF